MDPQSTDKMPTNYRCQGLPVTFASSSDIVLSRDVLVPQGNRLNRVCTEHDNSLYEPRKALFGVLFDYPTVSSMRHPHG